ncbi:hypothetical protein TNCV_3944431 [Trichonephila clavipes]|nr:hypothetical protein TNCV_3944431 [Trichonephila clavipes]
MKRQQKDNRLGTRLKMIPQTSEEVFMREPAIAIENEIGFDFTATPFFTSPLMEVYKNMQEINLKETILPAFVSSGKIATDLPQMGLEEILCYQRHYSKSIDELTSLENRTVQQNCNEWRLERKLRLTDDVKKLFVKWLISKHYLL